MSFLLYPCNSPGIHALVLPGINIIANRLFGPPPRTSTYVCIWEIQIGDVKGRLSIVEGRIILASVNAFGMNFTDPLDAPAPVFALPIDPDSKYTALIPGYVILNRRIHSHIREGYRRQSRHHVYRRLCCSTSPPTSGGSFRQQ